MNQSPYCAFISYRHQSPDMEIAKRLHTLIENYTIPAGIRREKKVRHPGKVFRDQEELPLSADLGKDIETALDNSQWLIAICSPRYLQSKWCMREIEYFIEKHGRERVLTVLVEGEPQDSFPEALLFSADAAGDQPDVEPLAADVRAPSLRGSLKKLKKEKLRILAPMLDTSYDGLYRRQRRRNIARGAAFACAAAALGAGFFVYSTVQNRRIESQRITSAQNACDLLLEQSAAAFGQHRKAQGTDLALQACDLSDSLGGYRRESVFQLLKTAGYAGDLSVETQLDAASDLNSLSSLHTTEFFSPDGRRVLSVSAGYTLDCCDAVTGEKLWSSRMDGAITSARWKADGSLVAVTAHMAHALRLIDTKTGETVKDLILNWVDQASFVGDDLFACFEKGFVLWHLQDDPDAQKMEIYMAEMGNQSATCRVFENGRFIVAHTDGFAPYTFGIIDTQREMMATYDSPFQETITGYAISPDGSKLFIHQYKTAFVCAVETEEVLWRVDREQGDQWPDTIADMNGASPVWAGDYIFDNERTHASDYNVYTGTVYDANTGEILYTLDNEYCLGVTADGQYFLCAHGIYRVQDGQLIQKIPGRLLGASRDGKHYLVNDFVEVGLGHGTQRQADSYQGEIYADLNELHRILSPDDRFIVLEGQGGGFTVASMEDGGKQYRVHDFFPQWWINFSPDSRLVALGSGDSEIAVYELETGNRLYYSQDWKRSLALGGFTFSRDGAFLMAAEKNKSAFCVASMESGETVYMLHATKPVAKWGFDEETGDAVIVYEDGSALIGEILTTFEEARAFAEAAQAARNP